MKHHAIELQQKPNRIGLFLPAILLVFLIFPTAYSQTVTIYENPDFGGRSRTFGVGDYRFFGPQDFNDMASSIRVPAGFAAVIYEHANEAGGYGKWVDLLEDCRDLSQYNFNEQVSFLRVFSINRPGFFYARNSMRNGEFVAGHWEGRRAGGNPPNPIAVVAQPLESQARPTSVTIYENPDFGGRSKTFGIGNYRFFGPQDFNDMASSIRVPAGFAAVIYEHADEAGGYGKWVDLLEDCRNLSQYNFNEQVSFLRVFSINRPGFFYARSSMRNGEFVAGHWEGIRAGGNPPNPIAVVAPALQSQAPPRATAIQDNNGQFIITSLGAQSSFEAAIWDKTDKEEMGVIGSDFRGVEEIGSAAFQRASNNVALPDNINFWYPQKQPRDHRSVVYFKRTLTGIVDDKEKPYIVDITGTYEDDDMTLHLRPNPPYMYMITDGHAPEQATIEALKTLATERENPYGDCDKPFTLVEAEIDATVQAKNALNSLVRQRVGKQVSVYGPWIYDRGHCHHPEIHPAEQIWWSENAGRNKQYNLNLFADASKRFWWRSQMDDGTKLKPWGAPPIKGTFALTFEVKFDPNVSMGRKKFEVSNIDFYNVTNVPNGNKTYNLIYQNQTLVSFVPNNDAFKVSFERVGLKPGTTNTVRGFLVLELTVGTVKQIATRVSVPAVPGGLPTILPFPLGSDPNKVPQAFEQQLFKKTAGHYMFSILRTEESVGSSTIIR